jgi:hypothetical protein
MINIAKLFCRLKARHKVHYQSKPTGSIEFSRLIAGRRDFWVDSSPSKELVNKKLILATWMLKFWLPQKIGELKTLLMTLMTPGINGLKEGFEIYVFYQGKLVQLTNDNLDCLDSMEFCSAIEPFIKPSHLRLAAESGIFEDDIHILDDYWVDQLLSKEEGMGPRSISCVNLFMAGDEGERYEKIFQYLEKAVPPVERIDIDYFFKAAGISELWRKITRRFPKALLNYHPCDHVILNSLSTASLCVGEKLIMSSFPSATLHLNDLYKTATLYLISIPLLSNENLIKLLSKATNLKKLDFISVTLERPLKLPTEPKELKELKELGFSTTTLYSDNLIPLLIYAPNLYKLTIMLTKILDILDFREQQFKAIEELDLNTSTLSLQNLQNILQALPHLKKLSLLNCTLLPGYLNLEKGALSQLEDLEIKNTDISLADLKMILQACPKLKRLTFYGLNYFSEGPLTLDPSWFKDLEELNLDTTNISPSNFLTWVKGACSIKQIRLSSCRHSTEVLAEDAFRGLNLSSLQTLDLSRSDADILGNNIFCSDAFLQTAQHIKRLELGKCQNFEHQLLKVNVEFSELDYINLFSNTILWPDLLNLLRVAPNLRVISLACCDFKILVELAEVGELLEKEYNITTFQLEKVEELNLEGSNITMAQFQALLTIFPNLRKINIKNCSALYGQELYLLPEKLPFLEALEGKEFLSPESLMVLQAAATKLTYPTSFISATPLEDKYTLDADTGPLEAGQIYHTKRYLYPLDGSPPFPVRNYRRRTYSDIEVNRASCALSKAFSMSNKKDSSLVAYTAVNEPFVAGGAGAGMTGLVYGHQKLRLSDTWHPLVSLSPGEELIRYYTIPNAEIDLAYSHRDNLYYIRHRKKGSIDIEIDFTLKIPPPRALHLPDDIRIKVEELRAFNSGALELSSEAPTGFDYLAAISAQKKGACRHRVFVFKKWMDEHHPEVPTRIVMNDVHAFVEIQMGEDWHSIDLGGYPARIAVENTLDDLSQAQKSTEELKALDSIARFKQALKTWEENSPLIETNIDAYAQLCMASSSPKKRLIECTSSMGVQGLSIALRAYGAHTSRPVFYVDSPKDLECAAAYIHHSASGRGELRRGPGGPLFDFLQAHPDGVLIINYDQFETDDIIRFNSVLDDKPQVDGVPLPPTLTVIGLRNSNKSDAYKGADFYSRFHKKESCPIADKILKNFLPKLPVQVSSSAASSYVIELFEALDWKEILLGRWVLDGGRLLYVEGELTKALAAGANPIEIRGGLWKDEAFIKFWQETLYLGLKTPAGVVSLPPIVRNDTYDWEVLRASFEISDKRVSLALNPYTLHEFFNRFRIDSESRCLIQEPGFIVQATAFADKKLSVYLTSELDESAWAKLLTTCQKEGVTLSVSCAPEVALPEVLYLEENDYIHVTTCFDESSIAKTRVIETTDVDTTVAILTRSESALIIDVSELSKADVLQLVDVRFNEASLSFEFSEKKSAILRALEAGQRVILKGAFSQTLADGLASFILKRQEEGEQALGVLMVINENNNRLRYAIPEKHSVTVSEKKAHLSGMTPAIEAQLAPYVTKASLGELQSRCDSIIRESAGAAGSSSSSPETGVFDATSSAIADEQFMANRRQAVRHILQTQPYVFLGGLSGVGKTTFVQRSLCKEGEQIFYGESALKDWATSVPAPSAVAGEKNYNYIFLDEANINGGNWTIFEDLFNNPPSIFLNGEYYPLTSEHKVIFAGNPLSYSEERKESSLFERHGNRVNFDVFPPYVLYEEMLKPLFKDTLWEGRSEDICIPLLKVYAFLAKASTKDVLISPRELQMMALLTVSYCLRHDVPTQGGVAAAYFAYHLGRSLVPASKQVEFDTLFKEGAEVLPARPINIGSAFFITPSRKSISHLLEEYLALREIRHEGNNLEQRTGGLGGIILEGPPGAGKSELVLAMLRARGYEEIHDLTGLLDDGKEKRFYRLPVSWSFADKEKLLIKAFDEGAVVVIDEINSSPMMEKLLNELLMGHYQGRPAAKPGFMVIGTQNPASMTGRQVMSTALARRMATFVLPDYTLEEIEDILKARGLVEATAKQLAKAYHEQVDYAYMHDLKPPPTFRDLLRIAEREVLKSRLLSREKIVELEALIKELERAGPRFFSRGRGDGENVVILRDILAAVAETEDPTMTIASLIKKEFKKHEIIEGTRIVDTNSKTYKFLHSIAPELFQETPRASPTAGI